jgi:glycosyltransferase involved in cell wall biosynthesis
MKILLVSTVYNSTPPTGYGGIQRVVHYLGEALVRLGHEVILLAPPRSRSSGRVVHVKAYDPDRPWAAVRKDGDLLSEEPLYEVMRDLVESERVDVIHDFSFRSLFVLRHPDRVPHVVSTCIPPAPGFARPNLVACSAAHARLIGGSTRFVHYGLPLRDWPYRVVKSQPPVHIAKLARIKGQHLAILAARLARSPLVLAGNVESRRYERYVVRPMLRLSRHISHVGEIDGVTDHLLHARALVQTPRWFDCFPLVCLEALACATPVIALAEGGVPEQIRSGVTGFLCNGLADLTDALRRIGEIDPSACRADAEERFSDDRMANEYVELYRRAAEGERW